MQFVNSIKVGCPKGYKQTEEHKKKAALARIGSKRSLETRQQMSESGKAYWGSDEGRQRRSELVRQQWARLTKEQRLERCRPWLIAGSKASLEKREGTSIELAICAVLDVAGVKYRRNYQIGNFFADIYVARKKLVIECDGDYWHSRPEAKRYDPWRDNILKQQGYTVIRIWERDIRKNPKKALIAALKEIS